MTAALLYCAVSLAAARPSYRAPDARDVQPDGTIYRRFDYDLMAQVHARAAARRESYGKYTYDPETWLPVAEKRPAAPPRPIRPDDSALRAARIKRAALRRRRSQASGGDPLWWINSPALGNPGCPWSYVTIPAAY